MLYLYYYYQQDSVNLENPLAGFRFDQILKWKIDSHLQQKFYHQEIKFTDELIQKINDNEKIRAVVFTNAGECEIGRASCRERV